MALQTGFAQYRDLKLALAVLLIACVAGRISVGVLYCFAMVLEPREFLQATRRVGIQLASRGGSPTCPLLSLSHQLDSMYKLCSGFTLSLNS